MKKNKKTLDDAVQMLDEICYDLEETYGCGDIVTEHMSVEDTVMDMTPQEHIRLFESMQDYIEKMRVEVEFLIRNISLGETEEDFPDNEETLCDRCNKRLTRKERNR